MSKIALAGVKNAAIIQAFENTLSRDGSAPNGMNADLDMNNKRVFNLPAPTTATEPIRKAELDAELDTLDAAVASAVNAAAAANTALDLFTDVWLGEKPTDPSVDNDGNPLKGGAIYYNTADSILRIFKDSVWTNAVGPGVAGPTGDKGDTGAQGPAGDTGPQGPPGNDGIDGVDGVDGSPGADGSDGVGVPVGGTTGQILAKNSNTDFDTEWIDVAGGSSSSAVTGSSVIDFGTHPGSNEASVSVTGQTAILVGSVASAFIMGDDTTSNHTASDHKYAGMFIALSCGTPTTATGFTIHARSPHKLTGQFAVRWQWQ